MTRASGATPWSTDTTAEALLGLERRHQRWFRTAFTTLRLGEPARLRDELLQILPNLRGARFGDEVNWSKGQLSILPREILEREVRIEVRAHTEHPYARRTAHYESVGELVLELPSGWPKSYRAQGSWKLPVYPLRGEEPLEGTCTNETAWTSTPNAPPPLPLPADAR